MITCSTPMLVGDAVEVPARTEHRDRDSESSSAASGSLSRKPIGFRPSSGLCEEPLRRQPADLAGADDQRRPYGLAVAVGLRARPLAARTRPAARYGSANAQVRIVWAERSGGAEISSRSERTAIAASEVAIRTTPQLLEQLVVQADPYMPRTAETASTKPEKTDEPDRGRRRNAGRARAERGRRAA